MSSQMKLSGLRRRGFLLTAAAGSVVLTSMADAAKKIHAVAFDGLVILDPRPIAALVEELYPGRGEEFTALWRSRQFEYTWLRSMMSRYADFRQVTEDALVYTAAALHLELPRETRSRLVESYQHLRPWPDVADALRRIKSAGFGLSIVSNMTASMLLAGLRNGEIDGLFDHVLSTDRVQVYKPHADAYQMSVKAFGIAREQIVFAAFAGWDTAGAKAFGHPTFWVNRQNQAPEVLGVEADGTGPTLNDLVNYLGAV
ncbi:MAG TPA: haloacid dehalogenase type II [Bryobacteraceae bacterium]|nr:haloacid dehalogenase type II [Bryobacteraceae bacterium]